MYYYSLCYLISSTSSTYCCMGAAVLFLFSCFLAPLTSDISTSFTTRASATSLRASLSVFLLCLPVRAPLTAFWCCLCLSAAPTRFFTTLAFVRLTFCQPFVLELNLPLLTPARVGIDVSEFDLSSNEERILNQQVWNMDARGWVESLPPFLPISAISDSVLKDEYYFYLKKRLCRALSVPKP